MNKNALLIIDDVHLEGRPSEMHIRFAEKLAQKIQSLKDENKYPILVCAGDIAENDNGLKWIAQFDCEIVYVCGNHEFWGNDYYEVIENLEKLSSKVEYSHIHFLHNSSQIINGIKFIGATLWTDLAQSWNWFPRNQVIKNFLSMADFRRISAKQFYESEENIMKMRNFLIKHGVDDAKIDDLIENKKFNPYLQIQENKKSVEFIENEMEQETHPGQTVVVTHHLPCPDFWMKKFKMGYKILESSKINDETLYERYLKGHVKPNEDFLMMGFYVNTLYDLFERNDSPNWWIHGHFHQEVLGYIGKTQIISSPVGYLKQSEEIKFKEVVLENNINNMIDYLKKEIETYEWNTYINENLKNFENLISQCNSALSMGLISINDFKIIVETFSEKHEKNMELLEQKLLEWFNILLGVTRPNFYNLKHRNDFHILSKIMNLDKAKVEGGLKFTMPSRFNFIVNQLSFLTDEKFKALNKNDSNIHYKDWIKEIQKVQIQVGQLKNFLIQLVETQRQL